MNLYVYAHSHRMCIHNTHVWGVAALYVVVYNGVESSRTKCKQMIEGRKKKHTHTHSHSYYI